MKFKEVLTYDDVLLLPQYSDILSRQEVNIGNHLDKDLWFDMPIISAPMDTVTGCMMASSIYEHGGLGIIHRYNTIEQQVQLVKNARNQNIPVEHESTMKVGAAVGVTGDFEERVCALYDAGVGVICVDIAHGYHILMERAIKTIKNMLGNKIHIMAGNVATLEGFNALADWGADSVRIGIGGGSICSTRIMTGHGMPTLQSIIECAESNRNAILIADGGIRNSGDIVKALAAGADFVMVGSLLAGTDETPGEIFTSSNGKKYKTYRGMASKAAQLNWKGNYSSNEGISTTIKYKGPVNFVLEDLKNGIKSGLSYSGVRNVQELQENSLFIRQTTAGLSESHTHILKGT